MKTRLLILGLFLAVCHKGFAQIGGRSTFEFLRLPTHASLAALGGVNTANPDSNANLIWQNPALLSSSSHQQASLSYSPFYASTHYTTLAYAHEFEKTGTWGFGLQYLSYGEMEETDAAGNILGTFRANDFAINVAKSWQSGAFRYGANIKFIASQIAGYGASAVAIDLGGSFQHPHQDLSFGLVIKNIGFPLSRYIEGQEINMPFDVQLGGSFKPEYMPFRFSVNLHHLYRFDIVYLDPDLNATLDANGNRVEEQKTFFDKLARHFVIGGDVLLTKGFTVRLGYNHLINREMRLRDISSFAGFSFGFALKVKSFDFAFSRATYHLAGARSFITLRSNLKRVLKRKTKI